MPEHSTRTDAHTPYRDLPEPDRRLIEFYLEPEIPIHELARACGLTLPELDEKLADPRIAREIERITRLTRERHAAIQSAHASAPETELLNLTRDRSTNPETKRKAATKLLTKMATAPVRKRDFPGITVRQGRMRERDSQCATVRQGRIRERARPKSSGAPTTGPTVRQRRISKRDSTTPAPSTTPDPPHAPGLTTTTTTTSGSERTPAHPTTHHFTLTPTHLNTAAGKIFPAPIHPTPRAPPTHRTVA